MELSTALYNSFEISSKDVTSLHDELSILGTDQLLHIG